jgi:hypothetical protein
MLSPDRPNLSFGALFAAEVHNVGLAVRREAFIAAICLGVTCLLLTTTAIRYRDQLTLMPELLLPSLLVALVLPWIVWKGDPPFGRAYLWTLPVRRQQAAAAKIAAGAVWLILAIFVGFAMLAAVSLATGGTIGLAEDRLVGTVKSGLVTAARVPWSTPLWMWAVPFGGALAAYAASSALLLGIRHPVRSLGGVSLAMALLGILAVNLGPNNALEHGLTRFADTFVGGRWGLDFALTGGVTSLSRDVHIEGQRPTDLWVALPTAGRWAGALLIWFGAALIALALALRRHWER